MGDLRRTKKGGAALREGRPGGGPWDLETTSPTRPRGLRSRPTCPRPASNHVRVTIGGAVAPTVDEAATATPGADVSSMILGTYVPAGRATCSSLSPSIAAS